MKTFASVLILVLLAVPGGKTRAGVSLEPPKAGCNLSIPGILSASSPYYDHSLNNNWPKIHIGLEHGDWDSQERKCVEGKGLCRITIDVIFDKPASGQGGGDLWYQDGRLCLVAIRSKYSQETFNMILGGTTYTLNKDFHLPDDICDALGIERGYIIKSGKYVITVAGGDYAAADRKVIFNLSK